MAVETMGRVWVHRGLEYTEPPVAMIVDAILGHVYGGAPSSGASVSAPYEQPENLARFFAARTGSSAPEQRACCSSSERESCCDAEAIWQDFHGRLLGFIARRVEDRGSAEDILQEVMLRIHRHVGGLERAPAVGAWVHQIARNAIADHYRRASVRRERPAGIAIDREEAPVMEPVSSELRGELAVCLAPLVARLPAIHQEALTLTEFEGLTQPDAAARLGLRTAKAVE